MGSRTIPFLAGIIALGAAPQRAGAAELGPLTAEERLVLERVGQGRVADLGEAFGKDPAHRHIRAAFLEALLSREIPGAKIHRTGVYLLHAIIDGILDAGFVEVSPPVILVGCDFMGAVDFSGARFDKSLAIKNTVFHGPANFYRFQARQDLFLGESVFQSSANFGGADIGGQLVLSKAQFLDAGSEVSLNGLRVGQTIAMKETVFQGGIDLAGARIGGELNAAGARFESTSRTVVLGGLSVGQSASFLNAKLKGPFDGEDMDVSGDLVLDGARFESETGRVTLTGIKVGRRGSLDGTVFRGPADFTSASFNGVLMVSGARFEKKDERANFFGVRVGQQAFFMNALFEGGATFAGARIEQLMLDGSADHPPLYKTLNLDGAMIAHTMAIGALTVESLEASRLQVGGAMIMRKLGVSNKADLRDASVQSLKMIDVAWPTAPEALWLEGFSYRSASAGEGPDDWKKLLEWIDRARYDTRNYNELESFFRHSGYDGRADEVYIRGHRRADFDTRWTLGRVFTVFFWDALAGYGKKPTRTFWLSLAIVFFGMFVFSPDMFDQSILNGWPWIQSEERRIRVVMRFLLSLGMFLPGVDLGLSKLWPISRISFPALLYYHFHKLAGWILVPIGLASVFAQFR